MHLAFLKSLEFLVRMKILLSLAILAVKLFVLSLSVKISGVALSQSVVKKNNWWNFFKFKFRGVVAIGFKSFVIILYGVDGFKSFVESLFGVD